MLDLLEAFKEEASVIAGAPWSFFIVLAVVGFAIWVAMKWAYETRLINLNARMQDRDEKIAMLKEQLAERDGRIKVLEVKPKDDPPSAFTVVRNRPAQTPLAQMQQRLQPRRLTDDQRLMLGKSLRGVGKSVRISYAMRSADGPAYKDDWLLLFKDAGWEATATQAFGGPNSRAGLALGVGDPHHLTALEMSVHEALFAADIPHDLDRRGSECDVEIQIGERGN